jgi:hypothetical protein
VTLNPTLACVVALAVLVAGCGASSENDSGYVTALEAQFFFNGHFGGKWRCIGHEPPDPSEPLVDAKLAEEIEEAKGRPDALPFGFVTCRLQSGGNEAASENGIQPGSVLTYGFP